MKLRLSIAGIIVFALPMLINVIYVLLPPVNAPEQSATVSAWLEGVEQVTRILYMLAICLLVSKKKVSGQSPWLYAAIAFLILYYIVWIRYFAGGRDIAQMSQPFLLVPMPLAVFPVLYFICAAIWLHNPPAVVFMLIFGVAHNLVSYASFR